MAHYYNQENIIGSVSVDCVVLGFESQTLNILLIKRLIESQEGVWALPGGFIRLDEHLAEAPKRILEEMSNVKDIYLEQVGAFGEIERFPPSRAITVGYYALVDPSQYELYSFKSEALEARWFPLSKKPRLPYDHDEIVDTSLKKLKRKLRYEPIGFELLPKKFSLRQIQNLYEAILGVDLDNRNFRRKLLTMGLLNQLNEKQEDVAHRKAILYSFDPDKYRRLQENGFNFEL